ncbi:MAG: signal peptidase I [Emergencia sp.]
MKKCIAFLLAGMLGISAGIVLAVFFQITQVTDNSMLPGLAQGDHVLVQCSGNERFEIKRGDVVLFDNQVYTVTGEDLRMMKRVIALEGDRIMISGGTVYVNNRPLEEEYVFSEGSSGDMDEVVVPGDCVFVLGDNRAASTDSRSEAVGLVAEDRILGKVICSW